MKRPSTRDINQLYEVILQLRTVEECQKFFRDLLTETEIQEITERWKAAQMLAAGIPYSTIEKETGLSSRTIARVHKWLKRGKGGYALMLRRIQKAG
jgi:TrpR-related protein YerC/YecD